MPKLWSAITLAALLAGATVPVAAQSDEDPTTRPPIPSLGCGTSGVEPGSLSGSVVVDDNERTWTMRVPDAHDGHAPRPLWIQLHGLGEGTSSAIFKVADVADEQGVVVAAPKGTFGNAAWGWRADDTQLDLTPGNPDVAFLRALVDSVGAQLCIDLARVYLGGFSAGGIGVTSLACAMEDQLAAVAGVAGLYDPGDACDLDRPVPLIAIHSRSDSQNLFDGGLGPGTAGISLGGVPLLEHPVVAAHELVSIPDRATGVAVRNGCAAAADIAMVAEGVERMAWDCPPGADVHLIALDGGGHSWPSSSALDASEVIWEFFEQHPMPE